MDIKKFTTETRNPNTMNLDEMSALEIVTAMNNQDFNVPKAIQLVLNDIASVVDDVSDAFMKGGRLIYIGAGTSGRLGILDASECPPTFGVDEKMVVGIIAGGEKAIRHPAEGAEDNEQLAIDDLKNISLNDKDVLIGIAASGRTPYVKSAISYAKQLGCKTAAIACNKNSAIGQLADKAIEVELGPEILTGSTRLSSGTAQKLILNMISTASMVRIGKAYQNLMVDVVQSNEKLKARAENIVMEATGIDREQAREYIDQAKGNCKTAIVMILTDSNYEKDIELLDKANGHVKKAIKLV